MSPILCNCRRVVAIPVSDGRFESRHQGRVYRLREGDEITCQECHHTTVLELALDKERAPALVYS